MDIPFEPSTDIPNKPSTDESLKVKSKSSLISLTPDLYKPGIPEEGQASYLKEIIPEVVEIFKSPAKPHGKIRGTVHFPDPLPDEVKLLGKSIIEAKNNADNAVKDKRAVIYRNGLQIHVWAGHPHF